MISREKGLDQWTSNEFCKFGGIIDNGADLFRWSETRLNIQTNTINNLNGFEKF